MTSNFGYKCNDCGFRFNATKTPNVFIKCQRCGSKNYEHLAEKKHPPKKFSWTDEKYHGLKLRYWILLVISVVSSIAVGSVVIYVHNIFDLGAELGWVIPVVFIGGFCLPWVLYFLE